MYIDNNGVVYNDYNEYIQSDKKLRNLTKYELLSNGKFEIYRNNLYAEYSKFCSLKYGTEMNKKYEQYLGIEDTLSEYEKKCCKQIYDSRRQKILRLKKKLTHVITNYDCLWLTLTFRDDVLDNTSEKTRRIYISRFLKSLNVPFYVANIDFGDKVKNLDSLEREHYHAVIQSDYLDMSLYNYGFIYVERIRNTTNSIKKISKYINKLTAHAYKDSTKGLNRLIYSRNR
ncbi:MAG: hypothetical protein E7361_03130 [Clostridiales bacterium]|nr:hypothetical protein [Clostridiales bacterium]